MKRVIDTLTGDLFATIAAIPKAHPMDAGAWRFRAEISHCMGGAISASGKDRYQIAADMSRLLGREVSVNTLDKYTSEASEDHIPNLETAIAFDAATGQLALVDLFARKLGCRVLPGKESLAAELGRLEIMKGEIAKQERVIKRALGDAHDYLAALCEVSTDQAVAMQVYEQSRGRYRLMSNACRTLEVIAGKMGKTSLSGVDIKGIRLCEDAMKSLKKGA